MENLENKSIEGELNSKNSLNKYQPSYKGLQLIENKPVKGGTSIQYWM
jgi:hypothetical protein